MHAKKILIPLSLLLLVYSALLAALSMPGFPNDMHRGGKFPYLAERPLGEDAYYMLTVSWNMASGEGIVYNHNSPVTGIQPLSTVVYAIVAKATQTLAGDRWLFLRLIIFLESLLLLFFGHFVGKISSTLSPQDEKNKAYSFAFLIAVFNFSLFRLFTYGLETSIYLLLTSICILYSISTFRSSKNGLKEAVSFGILGGLTIWARIDFGIVFFVFLFITFLRNKVKLTNAVIAGTSSLITVSPWFFYVRAVSGEWMPSSGPAQSGIVTISNGYDRITGLSHSLLDHLTPWFYFEVEHIALTWTALVSLLFLTLVLFYKKSPLKLFRNFFYSNPILISWIVSILSLTIIYLIFFRATHFYTRYSAPLVIPILTIMAMCLAHNATKKTIIFEFTFISALLLLFAGWSYLSFHSGRIGVSFPVTAGYVQAHASDKKVGAFQSGVIGFFNPNVVNLDGKVNQQALKHFQNGTIQKYIDLEQIDILIDWPQIIHQEINDPEWLNENWEPCTPPVPDDVQNTLCLQRK